MANNNHHMRVIGMALRNAGEFGLSAQDVVECWSNAKTPEDFNYAVCLMADRYPFSVGPIVGKGGVIGAQGPWAGPFAPSPHFNCKCTIKTNYRDTGR